ncbi:MAG: tetratricopeptide repeat protein [Bacteroidetes bacterium]|jgi:tetratricopeptide (TPR) repeat protein|nr:tetratricopeptide repeat protein [Bacteroidota bacterium]
MGKAQWILLIGGFVVVALIYLTFETRPPEAFEFDKSRSFQMQRTSVTNLVREKLPMLSSADQMEIRSIKTSIENSSNRADSITLLKKLSGAWYEQKQPVLAGYYAEMVAEIDETPEAWSMAGTTYAIALHNNKTSQKEKVYAANQSRNAFENAISLDPKNINHRINLALTYVRQPLENQPMKGIQMLLELNEKYPNEEAVLYQLGRLAIQTGQYEKAIERLSRVIELNPDRKNASRMLAEAYSSTNQPEKAKQSQQQCDTIKK